MELCAKRSFKIHCGPAVNIERPSSGEGIHCSHTHTCMTTHVRMENHEACVCMRLCARRSFDIHYRGIFTTATHIQ